MNEIFPAVRMIRLSRPTAHGTEFDTVKTCSLSFDCSLPRTSDYSFIPFSEARFLITFTVLFFKLYVFDPYQCNSKDCNGNLNITGLSHNQRESLDCILNKRFYKK